MHILVLGIGLSAVASANEMTPVTDKFSEKVAKKNEDSIAKRRCIWCGGLENRRSLLPDWR